MGLGERRRLAGPLGFLSGQTRRRSLDTGGKQRVTGAARRRRPHSGTPPTPTPPSPLPSRPPARPHPYSLNVGLPRPPKAPLERAAKEAKLVGRPKGSVGGKGDGQSTGLPALSRHQGTKTGREEAAREQAPEPLAAWSWL